MEMETNKNHYKNEAFVKKDAKKTKIVRFNTSKNVYIDSRVTTGKEYSVERRNAVCITHRNSFDVLRFLAMHHSWSTKGWSEEDMECTELFEDFLCRVAPELYNHFYVSSRKLS